MKKDKPLQFTTKRLRLTLMSDDELRAMQAETDLPHMGKAYGEMLEKSLAAPEKRGFCAPFRITRNDTGETVGDLSFKGAPEGHAAELGLGISEACRRQGYAKEAVTCALQYAFSQADVYFVEAQTVPGDEAMEKLAQACGFKPCGKGSMGDRWVAEKPGSSWMSIYMLFGMSIGMSLGLTMDKMSVGMSVGMCLGLALGAAMDDAEKKKRKQYRQERYGDALADDKQDK